MGVGPGLVGRVGKRPRLCWQPEPNTPHVGVEFSVLELWSLGKLLFFPLVSPPLPGDRDCLLAACYVPSCLPGKQTLVCSERWHGDYDLVPCLLCSE